MGRCAATPGEVRDWRSQFQALPQARADAVITMLAEVVADCSCGEPIRRSDPRRVFDGGLFHLRCAGKGAA